MGKHRALAVGVGLLLAALLLLLLAFLRERREPIAVGAAAAGAPMPAPREPSPAPAAPDAAPARAATMPEGLAQDLAMFNSDQLRAELESIALSYPAVVVLSVACDARPCTAELQVEREDGDSDDELATLNTFLDLVSKRFQGYLTASFRDVATRSGARAVRAVLFVGGDAAHPPPRYP